MRRLVDQREVLRLEEDSQKRGLRNSAACAALLLFEKFEWSAEVDNVLSH